MKLTTLFAAAASAVLLACAPADEAAQTAPEPEAKAPSAASSQNMVPDFATAMARHKPLMKVEGAPKPLDYAREKDGEARYADAIKYAANMDSYNLIIWKDGKLAVQKSFAPHTADLRPESASMHKSVMALLAAAAIADGFIPNMDVKMKDYFPEWNEDARGEITLRQLLTMSSGLEPLSTEGGMQSPAFQFSSGNDVNVREAALGSAMRDAPDTVFHYNGVNSQIALMVIEYATMRPYRDYLSKRLWQPLGADDAYVWDYERDGTPRGHTALMAKAEDWLRIGLLIKDRGEFGGEQIILGELIDAATSPSKVNPNYGWQIWLGTEYQDKRYYNDDKAGFGVTASEPFAVDDMIYFDGFGGQRVYISRSENLVIVRQGAMRMDWDDTALPNMVIKASRE